MKIFKPKAEREAQQKIKNRKTNQRGAVVQRPLKSKQTKKLSLNKQVTDLLKNLERLGGIKSSWIFLSMLLMMLVSVSMYSLSFFKTEMPIQHVFVKGDFYQIDKQELENALAPLVGSSYIDVDIKTIKTSLMNFAWVQSVEVRKIWPASLEVSVVENQAIATWGEHGFVNEFGKVFKPERVNKELLVGIPDLNGLDKQSDLVLATYVQLSELSRRSNLKIVQFSLFGSNYWKLSFDQGSEVLLAKGRELQSLNTFLEVYQQSLKNSQQQVVRVDMRYNNGFSVEFGDAAQMKVGLDQGEQQNSLPNEVKQQIKLIEQVGKHHG